MDSYYAEVVMTECPHSTVEPFAVNARAARTERRSPETQGLRRVTQSGMPKSYLPFPGAPTQEQHPVREPVPPVVTAELGSFTPRQFRSLRGDDAHTSKNVIDQDLLDATDLSHHSSKESDKEEMPQSFGYLSEEDPNFQGSLEFVAGKQLSRQKNSVLGDGSGEEKESAIDHEVSGESGMSHEGHSSDSFDDESTEILKTLSSGDTISLTRTQLPAEDIPGVRLTRDNLSSGTARMQRNNLWTNSEVVGKKRDNGESILPGRQSTFDKSMPGTALYEEAVCRDQLIEPDLRINTISRVCHFRDMVPTDWPDQDREKYHQLELQALLGGPIPTGVQFMIRDLGLRFPDGWLRAVIRQMFRPVPRPEFHSAVFIRKRLLGRTSYPTFLDMGPSNTESIELQGLQMARISAANESKHFGNLPRKPGQVLLTPGQYKLLGARIVVLLKEISELPLLPIYAPTDEKPLGEATKLEVEYGIALIEYMLEVARGLYNNTISLEGRTNQTATLLVEFWWWLHRKAEYVMRLEPDRKRNCARIPGGSFVRYRKILQDADVWSEKLLFNHLAYAAMRCSDQGYVTLDQLLSPIELGLQTSVQQVAQYKEASLVQRGPPRDAFVATVSQQLTDRLQDCCQFIKRGQTELGIKAPTASLTNLPAENTSEGANKPVRGSTPEPATPESRVEKVRRSRRIAAARSMTVVAEDIPISNMEQERARELMLLARACANEEEAAGKDNNLQSKEGDDFESKPQSYQEVV
jgi:hypothetical protein